MSTPPETQAASRRERLFVAAVAIIVIVVAAYRASVGQSFYDDTFYVAVPWRFAHGARFLIDELSFQTIAEMISVPLVRVWQHLWGLTGIVFAIRLLWVAIAAAGAAVIARLLRPSFGLGVAAFAAAIPLLAPAYHVFSPTYNTLSSLLLSLALVLAFATTRDRDRRLAWATGVVTALGAAAYPPLIPAALVGLVTFAVVVRDWALTWRALVAAVAVGLALAAALLFGVTLADIRQALAFGSANVASFSTPGGKFQHVLGNTGQALLSLWLLPMWALALVACVPAVPRRLRGWALALVPAAAVGPGLALLARDQHLTFGTSAQSWLITVCAALLVPALVGAWRLGRGDLLRLVVLAAPFSAVGYLTVAYVTNSSWHRGMPAIALAPLAIGLLVCWGTTIAEEAGSLPLATGALLGLVVVFALLFGSVFGDDDVWREPVRVGSGAYAGLLTHRDHAKALDELAAQTPRWVKASSRVTFLGEGEAYLAVRGKPLTPATWLYLGPGDQAAIDYYQRVGRTPDVVFVNDKDVADAGGYAALPGRDPMLAWTLANYRRAAHAGGFSVFVRP